MEDLDFRVYNRRRGSTIRYTISKTSEGWYISYIAINGNCSPDGNPFFYKNFNQDYINYPSGFGNQLEYLWEKIDNEEIDRDEAQEKLQELADWVSFCEKSTPIWEGWN